jgi:tripartite-type tricarboxylate transporter receptor subunit TctC
MRSIVSMLAVAACGAAMPAVVAVAADTYPVKPIRLIVPFPPGGPADALARTVGDRLSAALGQAVIVDNRPGAAGNIGMELAAKAAPDGYTLVLAPAGNLTVNPSLYRNVPYDVARDFAPVTVIAAVPNILVVNPAVPAQNLAELIQYAKANPGRLNFSSPGSGSGAHLAGELFKSSAGVDIVHIPYNGIAPAVTAVVAGDVQLMFAGAPSALPQVSGGKLRALAVASPKRIAARPRCLRSTSRDCRDSTSRPGTASWRPRARRRPSSSDCRTRSPARSTIPACARNSPRSARSRSPTRPPISPR